MNEYERESYWCDWRSDYREGVVGGDNYNLESRPPLERRILAKIFRAMEEFFQFKIYSERSNASVSYSEPAREALVMAQKLKQLGVIDNISWGGVLSDEPKMFRFFASVRSSNKDGQDGSGFSFFSDAEAIWPAVGEALDRYSLINFSPTHWIDASYESISKNALNIFSLAGISPEKRRAGLEGRRLLFDDQTIFRWVRGYSLTRSQNIWVPLQLVTFYNWPRDREPYLRIPISTGNAVGRSVSQAVFRGLLEVVERDAFMITWLKKLSPLRLDMTQYPGARIKKILDQFSRYGLQLLLLELPTDVPCHVILALILDSHPNFAFLVMGLRASFDIEEAIVAAAQEAMAVRLFSRDYVSQNRRQIPELSESEKIKRLERILIWATRRDLESAISFLKSGPIKRVTEIQSSRKTPEAGLNFLIDHFKKQGTEVAYVENMPHDIRGQAPLTCAYVVVPEFQPMHLDESLPYTSGARLMSVPLKLGYKVDDQINTLPHPFP